MNSNLPVPLHLRSPVLQWSVDELCSPSLTLATSFSQQIQTALSKDNKVVSTCQLLKVFFSPSLTATWPLCSIFSRFQHPSFEYSPFSGTIWSVDTFGLGTHTFVPLVNSFLIHRGFMWNTEFITFLSYAFTSWLDEKCLKTASISRCSVVGQKGCLLISVFLVAGSHCQQIQKAGLFKLFSRYPHFLKS